MNKQSSYIFTFQAPTAEESIFWYSGRMHHTGEMLRNKQHAHNLIYKESIFFAASPEELGLTAKNKLVPTHPYQTLKTADTNFKTNEEIKAFILNNLKNAQKDHGAAANVQGSPSLRQLKGVEKSKNPRAICQAVSQVETIMGEWCRFCNV